MAARDVVVIGSGHNALVAACYLAREGLDVEVVERDTVLGGAVSTVERWPGYLVDRGSSAHIMVRHTGIVEDLRLDECGLTYLDMDPWGFAPFGDAAAGEQQAITFSVDLDRTCASIAALCGDRDADAYRAFVTDWGARNEAVFAGVPGRADRGTARPPPVGRRQGGRASAAWRCRGSSCSPPTSCSTSTSPTSGSRPRCPGSARSPARRRTRSRPPTWSAGTR